MNYLAFDLGADSGRAMLGRLTGDGLRLEEVHRFPNIPVRVRGTLHWDVLRLWHEVQEGLNRATQLEPGLASVGLDTWGCDFALLDESDRMIHTPVHYRDDRTAGVMDRALSEVPRARVFELSGAQFLPVNTLYQLLAVKEGAAEDISRARTFLTIPDLLNFWLTGRKVNEFTNATTTQCLDPRTMDWSADLLGDFGLPAEIFQEVVHPGAEVGRIDLPQGPDLRVIAPACHDTGSAVAAVPSERDGTVWISSGTWSIMGVVVQEAILSEAALRFSFANEGGVDRTYRFCKNIMGLWLIQECRRTWAAAGESLSYADLSALSQNEERAQAVLDPDHESFMAPGDMPGRIRAYCRATGQAVPETKGQILRCINDGLALKYRWVLQRLEETLDRTLSPIHIVGGGSQNEGLNQATADATDRTVVAGPVEATATGNIMVQAVASGEVSSFGEMGAVVRRTASTREFFPSTDGASRAYWNESYSKLLHLIDNPPLEM